MNAMTALGEKDCIGHTCIVPFPGIMHSFHTKRSVGTYRSRVISRGRRNDPSVAHVTIDCDSHGLLWLTDCDEKMGSRCLRCLCGGRRISIVSRSGARGL